MTRQRSNDSQAQFGEAETPRLKEPPSYSTDNRKISGHKSGSSPRMRNSERKSSRSMHVSSSGEVSGRPSRGGHRSSAERRSSRTLRDKQSSESSLSRSSPNDKHDKHSRSPRYSSHRKSPSRGLSTRSSSHRKSTSDREHGSSPHYHSTNHVDEESPHRRHDSRKRPSHRNSSMKNDSERVRSKSPHKRRSKSPHKRKSKLQGETKESSRDRRHDSMKKSSSSRSVYEKSGSERFSSRSPQHRGSMMKANSSRSLYEKSRSERFSSRSPQHRGSMMKASSSRSLYEKSGSERFSSRSPQPRGSGSGSERFSSRSPQHRGTRRRPSTRKPATKRSPGSISEYDDSSPSLSLGSPPQNKHRIDSNPFHAAISTPPFNSKKSLGKADLLYGTNDEDAKAKEKARRGGSERAINPGVAHVSSNNSVAVNTLYGDDADAKAKAKASRGSRHHGAENVFTGITHSRVTAVDVLYGSEGDAKAKARAGRGSFEITSSPGVESVYYDSNHSYEASPTDTLYGSDADAKSRAKASKYGLSPGMSGRTASTRTMGMASLSESMRSSGSNGFPYKDDMDAPIARKLSIRSSGSSKNENLERKAGVSSTVIHEFASNDSEESSSDGGMETREARNESRKSRKRGLLLLFLLLLLICGGAAVWYFLFRSDGSSKDNSQIDSLNIEEPSSSPSISGAVTLIPVLSRASSSPSIFPSMFPTQSLLYERPSESDCEKIAGNKTIAGREEMENANFGIDLEVVLADNITMTEALLEDLLDAIQEKILPSLAGCSVVVDRFLEAWRFVIFDAFVKGNVEPEESCIEGEFSGQNCHRVFAELALFLKGRVRFLDIIRLISDEQINFSNHLGLSDTFLVVKMIGAKGLTPTASPTVMPSVLPSLSPSELPTVQQSANPTSVASKAPTKVPTDEPSASPTVEPSASPNLVPSDEPTASPNLVLSGEPTLMPSTTRPSWKPSMGPTEFPTESPSSLPTLIPMEDPTARPSMNPSRLPSSKPSKSPTWSPSSSPSRLPSKSPSSPPTVSPAPSRQPSPKPTQTPSAEPSKSPTPGPSSKPSATEFFWVACGAPGSCGGPNSVQNANHNMLGGLSNGIAVRCCSDTPLGGFSLKKTGCPHADSICDKLPATYYEAKQACSSVGSRLCTLAEMMDGCTNGTGCQFNFRFCWTSDPGGTWGP